MDRTEQEMRLSSHQELHRIVNRGGPEAILAKEELDHRAKQQTLHRDPISEGTRMFSEELVTREGTHGAIIPQ